MKRFSILPEFMPVFLACVLLINLTGCYTFRPVSVFDLSQYTPDEYNYVIKGEGVPFLLENPKISNGILSGTANPDSTFTHNKLIRIYPLPDYEILLKDTTNTFRLPIDSIAKIEKSEYSGRKTGILLSFLYILFH